MSAGQLTIISMTDSLLGEIVAALETGGYTQNTLLIITADHGGLEQQHGGDSPEETTIPWLAVGPGVPAGLTLNTPIVIYDTAATALYALNLPIPQAWDGRPILELFKPLSAPPK
jgi:arylsulfatase A-like enzyme